MNETVFLDSNVFINGKLFEKSNSRIILNLAEAKQIQTITSTSVLREVKRFFKEEFDEKKSYLVGHYIENLCQVIPDLKAQKEMNELENKINKKDLPNIAITKKLKIKTLISLDRDYSQFPEYITPKKFVEKIGLKAKKTEY